MKGKIFVIYHTPSEVISNSVYTPIAVGKNKDQFPSTFLRDDVGENIAEKNAQYNEMTAIYWVFQHLNEFKDTDLIGFSHYRRLFCFSELSQPVFVKRKPVKKFIDVDDDKLGVIFKNYDFVCAYPSKCNSVIKHYDKSHNKGDLLILLNIIKKDFPNYFEYAKEYLNGDKNYLYNMFVFKKEDFVEYSKFIFPLLEKFIEKTKTTDRLYVSERITGIFIYSLLIKNKNPLYVPVLFVRTRNVLKALKETKNNFKNHKEYGFKYKTKPFWLCFMPRWLESKLRRKLYK